MLASELDVLDRQYSLDHIHESHRIARGMALIYADERPPGRRRLNTNRLLLTERPVWKRTRKAKG